MSTAESARSERKIQHGPLCPTCGSATVIVSGEAVCPACVPTGGTVHEIAQDRVATSTTPPNSDARRRYCESVRIRIERELVLIAERAHFLTLRLGAVTPDREALSASLQSIGFSPGPSVGGAGVCISMHYVPENSETQLAGRTPKGGA